MIFSFTICSANYLPYAKALADSVIKYNSHHRFIIFLVDRYPKLDLSFCKPHTIICIDEMEIGSFEDMQLKYNIFELSCAIKPFAAEYILKTFKECESLFYFDSDIQIFNSLLKAEEKLQHSSILITPHFSKPINSRIRSYIERTVLRSGVFNAGFFGLRRTAETEEFLVWWKKRLEIFCYNDTKKGLFVDQLWLNLVPLLFKSVNVFSDVGYNVAYWNLDERDISLVNENFIVNNNSPLVFFHFSGYDFQNKNIVSKFLTDYTLDENKSFLSIFQRYESTVMANEFVECHKLKPLVGKRDEKKYIKKYNKILGLKQLDLKGEDFKIKSS